jgi:uncharacterized C2H2 Zn-finger protein
VFNKLLKAGVLTQEELDARVPMSERTVDLGLFICPACGNIQGKEFTKCPRCGFVAPNAPKVEDEKEVDKKTQVIKRERMRWGRKEKTAPKVEDDPQTDAAEQFEKQGQSGGDATGFLQKYCKIMGIVSVVAYIVVVAGLFVILAVAVEQGFPSLTQILVGGLAVALGALVIVFLVFVTLRAFNELTAMMESSKRSLPDDPFFDPK